MTYPGAISLADDDEAKVRAQIQMLEILDRAFQQVRQLAERNRWSDAAVVATAIAAYCTQVKGFGEAAGSLMQIVNETASRS